MSASATLYARNTSWATGRLPTLPPIPEGGFVDANSYLGEWPARRVNGSPPPRGEALVRQRLARMDRLGIRTAVVSSLEAVWLKDSSVANAELHALVSDHGDRFFPAYTLNPAFPAWADHLARCREEYGLAPGRGAVRLHPNAHVYTLEDARLAACLERLAELDVPVLLPVQLEDARLHQPSMRVPDLPVEEIVALVRCWPRIRWVIAAPRFVEAQAIGRALQEWWQAGGEKARVWLDLSRVQGPIDGIPQLVGLMGACRLLFGTNAPLHVPESAVMELADARLAPEDDTAIRYMNAAAALGIALAEPHDRFR